MPITIPYAAKIPEQTANKTVENSMKALVKLLKSGSAFERIR